MRQLATELRVNPNTVARAYRELESMGLVEARRGAGTRILAPRRRLVDTEWRDRLTPLIDRLLAEAWSLGIDPDEMMSHVNDRLRVFEEDHD